LLKIIDYKCFKHIVLIIIKKGESLYTSHFFTIGIDQLRKEFSISAFCSSLSLLFSEEEASFWLVLTTIFLIFVS